MPPQEARRCMFPHATRKVGCLRARTCTKWSLLLSGGDERMGPRTSRACHFLRRAVSISGLDSLRGIRALLRPEGTIAQGAERRGRGGEGGSPMESKTVVTSRSRLRGPGLARRRVVFNPWHSLDSKPTRSPIWSRTSPLPNLYPGPHPNHDTNPYTNPGHKPLHLNQRPEPSDPHSESTESFMVPIFRGSMDAHGRFMVMNIQPSMPSSGAEENGAVLSERAAHPTKVSRSVLFCWIQR